MSETTDTRTRRTGASTKKSTARKAMSRRSGLEPVLVEGVEDGGTAGGPSVSRCARDTSRRPPSPRDRAIAVTALSPPPTAPPG